MSGTAFSKLAAVIFSLLAIAQLARAVMGLPAEVDGYDVPIVVSYVAGAVLVVLALLGYTARRA
jgi:RsiW-degrading membrane proteinase PrsW (M82 family)